MKKKKPLIRCAWPGDDPVMIDYHDKEWGVPVHDDCMHFEFLVLDAAQAGLSWRTILHRREGYRRAFAGFDPGKVARFTEKRIEKLLKDPGIIRNRLKVKSAVTNARAFLEVQKEIGSFDAYIWRLAGGKTRINRFRSMKQLPAKTVRAEAMSRDLKKRGFTFVGPTICYAYMQAAGMVNDHTIDCFRYKQVLHARKKPGPADRI